MMNWRPLSKRHLDPTPGEDTLYEGVPPHLAEPLIHWLDTLFLHLDGVDALHDNIDIFDEIPGYDRSYNVSQRRAGRVAARLRVDLRSVATVPIECDDEFDIIDRNKWRASWSLICLAKSSEVALIDIIDATLADGVQEGAVRELEQLLAGGGSAWRVADDRNSLQRRVDPTTTDAFRQAATGNSAHHLIAAWDAAYGRHPNPSRAYSEAIKAVEAASIPVVIPGASGAKATLGKVIISLNDNSQDWELTIPSAGTSTNATPLVAMLRLLWQGQTDRHGGSTPTVPVAAQAAEAAVHLAVTLVQWFQSGAVRHVDNC